jgi:uncharacterized protein YbaR (Trm112 family)
MAIARTDPYGNICCPSCRTKLTQDDRVTLPGLFGITLLGDVATFLLAGVLVAIGMVWTPAYIVAAIVVCAGIVWHFRKRQRFVCGGCKRTYTRQELTEA